MTIIIDLGMYVTIKRLYDDVNLTYALLAKMKREGLEETKDYRDTNNKFVELQNEIKRLCEMVWTG